MPDWVGPGGTFGAVVVAMVWAGLGFTAVDGRGAAVEAAAATLEVGAGPGIEEAAADAAVLPIASVLTQ